MSRTDVAIIGAGPYGLALAAHLRGLGIRHRIFGVPMESWRHCMPADMLLKSEGFASNIADPDESWTLQKFCDANGHPYRHYGWPVPLDVFTSYGLSFQNRFAPELEQQQVRRIERRNGGFSLELDEGESFEASKVIVSSGLTGFAYLPPMLRGLPADRVSHSGDHRDYGKFKGMTVGIIGAGASATDAAAAAHAAGANVHLVSRRTKLDWIAPRTRRPVFEKWHMRDVLGAGHFGQGHFYSDAPILFHRFPQRVRSHIVRTFLGPRGGWPIRPCIERLPKSLGFAPERAEMRGGRVWLQLSDGAGRSREIETHHVISATGYRVDCTRLPFLKSDTLTDLKLFEGAPVLSTNFESSVRGLFFAGVGAANSFGPLMRFVAGTRFAARRISKYLHASH